MFTVIAYIFLRSYKSVLIEIDCIDFNIFNAGFFLGQSSHKFP